MNKPDNTEEAIRIELMQGCIWCGKSMGETALINHPWECNFFKAILQTIKEELAKTKTEL